MSNTDRWDDMSIGERIVRAAWMATREHLRRAERDEATGTTPDAAQRSARGATSQTCGVDQAAELRRLVAIDRGAAGATPSFGEGGDR